MNRLKIEAVFDGSGTSVQNYKVTNNNGDIWFRGYYKDCEDCINRNIQVVTSDNTKSIL